MKNPTLLPFPLLVVAAALQPASICHAAVLLSTNVSGSPHLVNSSSSGPTGSSGTLTDSDSGSDSYGSVVGRSSASHGVLRTYAEAHAADLGASSTFIYYINSEASFSDDITINSPGLTGQNGTLTVRFTVDGSLSSLDRDGRRTQFGGSSPPNWSSSKAEYTLKRDTNTVVTKFQTVRSYGTTSGTPFLNQLQTANVGFVYGTPFQLTLSLLARSDARADYGADSIADLEHTATWGGFESVKNSGGTIITDYTATSSSGTDYTQAIPEPCGSLLFALGLSVSVFGRSRFSTAPQK